MTFSLDKRDRSQRLRERLAIAMAETATSQAALARAAGVDRSTISQLLKSSGARLPNAQLVAECAAALGVSADWLLGLSERPEQAADLVALSMSMTEAPRALVDEHIFSWHREAEGYKIRHVPANLPDMLKTTEMLHWEYAPSLGRTTEQAVNASQDRLHWMRGARSDYEIAIPMHELTSFARAEGYYHGVPAELREEQLEHLAQLHDQLYPSLRIYVYDSKRLYSAPVSIFGPLLAAIYLGSNYLVFRDIDRITAITRHFDKLVREAEIASRELPGYLAGLGAEVAD